jgi:hypothetical protein
MPIEWGPPGRARCVFSWRAVGIQLENVDLGVTPGGPERRRTTWLRTAIALVVAGGLVLVAQAARPDDEVDVAVEETTTTTGVTTPSDPERGSEVIPAPIALGAPDDGKDSVGLPITVEPATGLVDGQLVTVTGSGFPAGEAVGVVMCTKEAGRDHGARGVEACNLGRFAQGDADDQGVAVVRFAVQRILALDGQEVDCASEPARCIIGMGLLSDYDRSGGFALGFDPDAPLPPPPTMELAKTEGIADGETVDAVITGLPSDGVFLQLCEIGTSDRCIDLQSLPVDDEGSYRGGVQLWRSFGVHHQPAGLPPNVDCAVSRCALRLVGEMPGNRIPPEAVLGFDATRGGRDAPTAELLRPGPFGPADTIEVRVVGVDERTWSDANICFDDGACYGFGQSSGGPAGARIEIDLGTTEIRDGCTCLIQFSAHRSDASGSRLGPPPLFPDPITVTITG